MNTIGKIILPIVSSAIVLAAAPGAFAEEALTVSEASASYGINAEKIGYSGEKAHFSLDIPSGRWGEIGASESEVRNKEEGSLEWDLFYGDSESGYVSCVFHQSDGGFQAEAASWSEMENVPVYNGTDIDGQPFCVAELDLYGFTAFIAEFPMGEDTWVNITMSFPEDEMDTVRDDINSMMSSFARNNASRADETQKSGENPNTGESALPMTVSLLLLASAGFALNALKNMKKYN